MAILVLVHFGFDFDFLAATIIKNMQVVDVK